jgi:hypothetical protein
MSGSERETARTAIALLLLARSDPSAVDELLSGLPPDELLDLGRWLSRVLSARCGWSTEVMAAWRYHEELTV